MIRVRFAHTPAGQLSLGAARVALANFLFARRYGGHVTLRLDDTEADRCRPEHAEAAIQDLQWFGMAPDAILRQSERRPLYEDAIARLQRAGRIYPCFESEEELRARREHRLKRGQSSTYDRAMLRLTDRQRTAAEAGGKRPYWRFRLSEGSVAWQDAVLGAQSAPLTSLSDPVVLRADGAPLPILTGAVDDLALGITHVIRGEERMHVSAVQLDLRAALQDGGSAVTLAHLPPLQHEARPHASRRGTGHSLRSLRHDGIEASALAVCLARFGTRLPLQPTGLDELAQSFALDRSLAPAPFDVRALLGLNRIVLRQLDFPAVADRLPRGATEAFWLAVRGSLDLLNEARGWWDVVAGTIVPPVIEGGREILHLALRLLPPEPWNVAVCTDWLRAVSESSGLDVGALITPLRLALTGEDGGPELGDLLPLIGRTRAANRLQIACA